MIKQVSIDFNKRTAWIEYPELKKAYSIYAVQPDMSEGELDSLILSVELHLKQDPNKWGI
jgi:hypothetical protein